MRLKPYIKTNEQIESRAFNELASAREFCVGNEDMTFNAVHIQFSLHRYKIVFPLLDYGLVGQEMTD